MYAVAEHDPEEATRVRRAIVDAARIKQDALRGAAPRGTYEHAFLRRDPQTFDDVDLALLERMAWHYRDRLPGFLRPRFNPLDPIVRERQLSRG